VKTSLDKRIIYERLLAKYFAYQIRKKDNGTRAKYIDNHIRKRTMGQAKTPKSG
jgi:hypothetical protein